ncbi:FAD-binding oxidoreductase [Aquamicrobium sp. LC103]|uniref:NAD(P)/FAD-dependent oxidoreductase n=1 Tax=Aquamicrobium sp. LC103 TaxID=1120658 RepID=UPI00063E7825|nr:FAD-binding oxidoreductase [Aquamicrobium sp. LC103]TKT77426.1 FAD-binding oxidoreductase [Aquamicrobium sp. LC103]
MAEETVSHFDVIVAGAGIAGASVAAELAGARRVLLLERESQPGYHTTGRSAALFSQTYGPSTIRALTRASAPFFRAPPKGFAENPLLSPRLVLMTGREEQRQSVERTFAEVSGRGDARLVSAEEARRLMPLLREDHAAAAFVELDAADIDVHALHHGYLRMLKEKGGRLETGAEVLGLAHDGADWRVETRKGEFRAPVFVNASGAWADEIAVIAGVTGIGLVPKRRTAAMIAAPEGASPDGWAMVVDIDEEFYLKPDAGRLLVSPADETPSAPCDAQPEEIDVAICIDRIETAFNIKVSRVENKWAGLRSFVADKVPVAGYAPGVQGFFWLAGQGGYGIQSAPGLSRTAAALVLGMDIPADISDQGVEKSALAADRPALSS